MLISLTPIPIKTMQLRQRMGEILETVCYRDSQYVITRKNKKMAYLVSNRFMSVLDRIMMEDKSLRDTIAIMMNEDLQAELKSSFEDKNAGKVVSLDEAFSEK